MTIRRYTPDKLRGFVFISLIAALVLGKPHFTMPATIAWGFFWIFLLFWCARGLVRLGAAQMAKAIKNATPNASARPCTDKDAPGGDMGSRKSSPGATVGRVSP